MKKLNREGETKLNNNGYKMTIINYRNCEDIDVQFDNGVILYNRQYTHFKAGYITNPYHPSVYGV